MKRIVLYSQYGLSLQISRVQGSRKCMGASYPDFGASLDFVNFFFTNVLCFKGLFYDLPDFFGRGLSHLHVGFICGME